LGAASRLARTLRVCRTTSLSVVEARLANYSVSGLPSIYAPKLAALAGGHRTGMDFSERDVVLRHSTYPVAARLAKDGTFEGHAFWLVI